jgi:hypothetical protein
MTAYLLGFYGGILYFAYFYLNKQAILSLLKRMKRLESEDKPKIDSESVSGKIQLAKSPSLK